MQSNNTAYDRLLCKSIWQQTLTPALAKKNLCLPLSFISMQADAFVKTRQLENSFVFVFSSPAVSRHLNSALTFLYSFIYSARLAALSLHCIICCLQWGRDSLIWNQTASLFGTRFQAQVNLNTVGNSIRTARQFYQGPTVCA